jgi:hypothetical protein
VSLDDHSELLGICQRVREDLVDAEQDTPRLAA